MGGAWRGRRNQVAPQEAILVLESLPCQAACILQGSNERNRGVTSTDYQRGVECQRIAMDRLSVFSKVLLALAALVVAFSLFWFAGGTPWLDTKVFPPRRPKQMPQNAIWEVCPRCSGRSLHASANAQRMTKLECLRLLSHGVGRDSWTPTAHSRRGGAHEIDGLPFLFWPSRIKHRARYQIADLH